VSGQGDSTPRPRAAGPIDPGARIDLEEPLAELDRPAG
jgi:hypothetical protein